VGAIILLLLLQLGWSTAMRNFAERLTRFKPLQGPMGSIFFSLMPILNTHTRTSEYEADMYGLNASRQPDGFAQAAIHLGEYRKMNPGPLEEWVFFDHPSGRNRIYAAMRWKAENLRLFAPSPTR
jgi:Zn-dependent protease with chaperone function